MTELAIANVRASFASKERMLFYLGAHHANWLAQTNVPLFVSRTAVQKRRSFPRARGTWALDSGGFTELSTHGRWTFSAREYARLARRLRDEVGGLAWCAVQDWMCEPAILAMTGLSVEEHQRRTIDSYLELRSLAPEICWVPVLQGWSIGDYWRHVDAYDDAGIDLAALPLVGLGSICRRQSTISATNVVRTLASQGIRLHGFGFKATGVRSVGAYLVSSDSMAWSFNARRSPPLVGCRHRSCANCLKYALLWRNTMPETEAHFYKAAA